MSPATQQRSNAGSGSRPDRYEDYVPVAERLERFYERFADGRVITHIIEHNSESGFVLMRAEVYRSPDDAQPAATGHAFEVRGESYVNKTSYIENCETGAVGRALALLGFEVKRGIASREEMEKVGRANAGGSGGGHLKEVSATTNGAQALTPQAERAALVKECGELFREMNARGYQPSWTGPSITIYVNGTFMVTRGMDALNLEQVRKLVEDLKAKRDRLSALPGQDEMAAERARLRALVEAEFEKRQRQFPDVTNYAADYMLRNFKGAQLADLSLDQLVKLCDDELLDTKAPAPAAVSGGQS